MRFSVCIPALRPATLTAAIASIQRQTWPDWELIVVGQGQDAALRAAGEAATRADRRVRYIHLPRRGLSVARNAALATATGDVIAMTDDDCEARPDWLATLAQCFEAEPDLGLVGGALVAPPRTGWGPANCPHLEPAEALYDPVAARRRAPPGWEWVGGNFAIRHAVAQRVGPFDECLGAGAVFPCGEDTDYKLRLEALGVKMRATPRAVVYHTYGTRVGWRATLGHSRNYARGNGALAAKLTLAGDARGRAWLALTARECALAWLYRVRPHRLPSDLLRLWHFAAAYRQCLREYRVDRGRGVLYALRDRGILAAS